MTKLDKNNHLERFGFSYERGSCPDELVAGASIIQCKEWRLRRDSPSNNEVNLLGSSSDIQNQGFRSMLNPLACLLKCDAVRRFERRQS